MMTERIQCRKTWTWLRGPCLTNYMGFNRNCFSKLCSLAAPFFAFYTFLTLFSKYVFKGNSFPCLHWLTPILLFSLHPCALLQ